MRWLQLQEDRLTLKATWILITISYAFSIWFRYLLSGFTSVAGLKSSGKFINTPDGFFFAKGALDLLVAGRELTFDSPTGSYLAKLTALLAMVLPFQFETIVFFLPAVLSSLVVIPLVLIGRSVHQTTMGFIAALVGSVAHSYYIRSQFGYYDTDMLTVTLPMFLIYFIIAALLSKEKYYLALITVTATAYQLWYPQAYSLNTAFFAGTIFYTVLFDRKNIFNYQIAFFILLGIVGVEGKIRIILAVSLCAFFYYKPLLANRAFWFLFAATFVLFAMTGGIDPLVGQIRQYLIRGDEVASSSLQFFNVISTVREAVGATFSTLALRTSGHMATFLAACLGYALALLAYRPLLFTLPMAGLGFLAMVGGLRFTIYGVPALALGFGYFSIFVTQKFRPKQLRLALIFSLTGLALYLNYLGTRPIKFLTVMNEKEIAALNVLRKHTKPDDYVVSWWDYGHPLRYYTNALPLIDGNKHDGSVNLPVAFALTEGSLAASAHILRIAAEHDYWTRTHEKKIPGYIENFMTLNHVNDPNLFFDAISQENYPLPQKNNEIYLVLPYQMIFLITAIQNFSNINLSTGEKKHPHFFLATLNHHQDEEFLYLDDGIKIEKKNWTAHFENVKMPIFSITITEYRDNRLFVRKKELDPDGKFQLIFMKDYNTVILADNKVANSTFMKLFVLEETDPRYFEPFVITPLMKIFKLKV